MEKHQPDQTIPNICNSPNCFRPASDNYEYCCPACQVKSSDTNDNLGHWRDCNKRHNTLARVGFKKQ